MFWEIQEIPIKKIEIQTKPLKEGTSWFYSKHSNLYIERKTVLEYKSIVFKENNKWKRIILDEKNFRLRKDLSKLLWIRYKENSEIKTILFPKEFVEVDESEINGLLSVIREQFRPKQRLSDGWYQWVEFSDSNNQENNSGRPGAEKNSNKTPLGWYQWVEFSDSNNQEYYLKIIKEKVVTIFYSIDDGRNFSGNFIDNKYIEECFENKGSYWVSIFKKLDESYKCCSKLTIDKLEEKFKEKYCV
jgi:hypothetical protein